MSEAPPVVRPGHGDHWLAALEQGDPRLLDAVAAPLDAPDGLALHRQPLTGALDMVQVTLRRRIVTAYPEPRATVLVELKPRELGLWDTRVEGWLTADHPGAGTLVVFLTDLAEHAHLYERAGRAGLVQLEMGALAYNIGPVRGEGDHPRLLPASRLDARFLPDDYWFEGEVLSLRPVDGGEVLEVAFQNGLELPVVSRERTGLKPGDRATGILWLTGRWADESKG